MLLLSFKLLLVPALIAAITLAGRRWGPALAGWFAGFPVVAGPTLCWIALEQGAPFAAVAAGGALASTCANVGFALAYAWAAVRWPWWVCLAAGYAAFAMAAVLLHGLGLGGHATLLAYTVAITFGVRAFPRGLDPRPKAASPRLELPVRMLAAAGLVAVVTWFASTLGPYWSGIFSAPPLLASILAAFAHPVAGAGFTVHLLRGMLSGFYALAFFCWGLTVWLPVLGLGSAFAAALAGAITVACIAKAVLQRAERRWPC